MTIFFVLQSAGSAWAGCGDCVSGDAPSAYTSEDCDNGGHGSHAVEAFGVIIATNDVGVGTDATEMWAVTDYGAQGGSHADDVSLWGTDTDGDDWCCICTNGYELYLEGTAEPDTLSVQWSPYELTSLGDVTQNGYGGDDVLVGGNVVSGITIVMVGNGDADTFYGGDAGEWMYGLNGADTCYGGDGADYIFGGAHEDTIDAGGGHDYVDGGAHDDGISGGPDGDELYGGNGDDHVCGGYGTGDRIHGGPVTGGDPPSGTNDDQLWAPDGAVSPGGSTVGDNANCGDTTASPSHGIWNNAACGSPPCCTYNLTTKPARCP